MGTPWACPALSHVKARKYPPGIYTNKKRARFRPRALVCIVLLYHIRKRFYIVLPFHILDECIHHAIIINNL